MLTSRPHQPRVQMLTCLFWEHMQHSLGREVPILPRPLTIPPCITPFRPLFVACGCVGVAAKPSVAYCLGVRLLMLCPEPGQVIASGFARPRPYGRTG